MHALYNTEKSVHITSEVTNQCKSNTFAFGVCFVEVEVDIPVGKIKVIKVINVHDSGTILNPVACCRTGTWWHEYEFGLWFN